MFHSALTLANCCHMCRLSGFTMSRRISRNPNTTTERPYSHAASPTEITHTAVAWIPLSESTRACVFAYVASTETDACSRLDLQTESVNHLGQHSDAISSINFAREQSVHLYLVSSLTIRSRRSSRPKIRSSLGLGTGQFVSGTPEPQTLSKHLTNSPNAFTTWTS